MYRNKEEFIKGLIEGYDLFVLCDIHKELKDAIIKTDDLSRNFSNSDISYLFQKGRIFLDAKEAIARNNEIRDLMLPYNDNRIFEVESGKLLIDANDESTLEQYGIEYTQNTDGLKFWTINYHCEYGTYHYGFRIIDIEYRDGQFNRIGEYECEYHPVVLFSSENSAIEACREVEKQLIEQPHSMDYWLEECKGMFFGVDMKEGYSSRDDIANLPQMLWDEYYPNQSSKGEAAFNRMEEVLQSQEGLYRKADSEYWIELVLRTNGSELHFRDNMVLIRDTWVHISMLYPLIGIHSDADVIRIFDIETEQVVLTEENYNGYRGRKLVYGIFKSWNETFIDEDTGEPCSVERTERIANACEILRDYHKDNLTFPLQVTFFKDTYDPFVDFLYNQNWKGYAKTLRELNKIIIGYDTTDELDAYTNVHKFFESNTCLSKIGRMRLDKALCFDNSKTTRGVKCDDGKYIDRYSTSHVIASDFIEIIKLLANKGEGYYPMTDKPFHVSDSELNKIVKQRKDNSKGDVQVAKECFEIDYALHSGVPYITEQLVPFVYAAIEHIKSEILFQYKYNVQEMIIMESNCYYHHAQVGDSQLTYGLCYTIKNDPLAKIEDLYIRYVQFEDLVTQLDCQELIDYLIDKNAVCELQTEYPETIHIYDELVAKMNELDADGIYTFAEVDKWMLVNRSTGKVEFFLDKPDVPEGCDCYETIQFVSRGIDLHVQERNIYYGLQFHKAPVKSFTKADYLDYIYDHGMYDESEED